MYYPSKPFYPPYYTFLTHVAFEVAPQCYPSPNVRNFFGNTMSTKTYLPSTTQAFLTAAKRMEMEKSPLKEHHPTLHDFPKFNSSPIAYLKPCVVLKSSASFYYRLPQTNIIPLPPIFERNYLFYSANLLENLSSTISKQLKT